MRASSITPAFDGVGSVFALGGLKVVVLALWLPVVAAATYAAWRLALRLFPRPAAVVAALALFVGLSLFPLTLERTVRSAYHLNQWRRAQAARPQGPVECLSGFARCYPRRIVDAARALVPPHARYYVQVSQPHATGIFRFWSFTALLPRVAVESPRDADWIVAWRSDPHRLPVSYSEIHRISALLTVAKVAP